MCTENTYSKHYLNRRTNVEAEVYKLVLFPSDNSIAVVKAKQCSPAEHDGFFFVQSGKKKFMGVILEEGSLLKCSEAADQLTKKTVNPEIESDYERNIDENQLKQYNTSTSAISTLKGIAFEEQNSNIQRHTASTITVSAKHSDHANTVQPSIVNNNDDFPAVLPPTTTTLGEYPTSTPHIVHKSNKKHDKCSKHKRRKQSQHETSITSFEPFEPFDNTDSEPNDNEDESSANGRHHVDTNQLSRDETPTFVGRPVIKNNKKSKNTSAKFSSSANQQLMVCMNKLESQYLRPLLVGQERIESMAKGLFANQKKIQNILRKQKVNISLLDVDENEESIDHPSFVTSLEYKFADDTVIDLIQQNGTKEHANRYVTSLMDLLYKSEEICSMETKDFPKDERYILLKEAVRNKFRLTKEELETMWVWLHNVILAKRRTINGKRKRNELITQHNNG